MTQCPKQSLAMTFLGLASLLLVAGLCGAAPQAMAKPVAAVVYAFGEALAIDASGRERRLSRGSEVASGDTLLTRAGRAQLRFSDGGYLGLQPESRVVIKDYTFEKQTPEADRSLLELLRGGVRFVTGVIGARNRSRYNIASPVATIGIRGSGGRAVMCVDGSCPDRADGLYLTGNKDILTLSNARGSEDVHPGERFFVQCPTCALTRVDRLPLAYAEVAVEAEPPAEQIQEAGEQRTVDASPVDGGLLAVDAGTLRLPVQAPPPAPPSAPPLLPLANGPGGAAITALGVGSPNFLGGLLGGNLTFDPGTAALQQYVDSSLPSNTFHSPTVLESHADGIVAWGLWNGGTASGGYASQIGSSVAALAYVVTRDTSSTPGALLAGLRDSFTVVASTSPIAVSGGVIVARGTPNTVTGTLNVDFPASSATYMLRIPIAGQFFDINGTARRLGTGPAFLGNSSIITSTAGRCGSGCVGVVPFGDAIQGFITGPNAERAGATYGFDSLLGKVTGSVIYHPASL